MAHGNGKTNKIEDVLIQIPFCILDKCFCVHSASDRCQWSKSQIGNYYMRIQLCNV